MYSDVCRGELSFCAVFIIARISQVALPSISTVYKKVLDMDHITFELSTVTETALGELLSSFFTLAESSGPGFLLVLDA